MGEGRSIHQLGGSILSTQGAGDCEAAQEFAGWICAPAPMHSDAVKRLRQSLGQNAA
jgi:hypothetical protein